MGGFGKGCLLVGAIMVLAGQGSAAPVAEEDFEGEALTFGAGDALGEWVPRIHDAPEAAFAFVPDPDGGASRCVRYTRTGDGNSNIHLDRVLAVEPDSVYEVRASVRSDGVLEPVLAVQTMRWETLATALAGNSAEWRDVRFLFPTYANTRVRFEWFPGAEGRLYTGKAGTSFLDDVRITRLEDADGTVRQAFAAARPAPGAEIDIAAVRPGPVGRPLPLRPITCSEGVLVYDDGTEVALWGVNLQTALSWEWRGRLSKAGVPETADALKAVTDRNLDELRELGTTVVRLHLLPSDFSDAEGNLRDSIYLDVLDHLIARCAESGIYVYLTLVNEMNTLHFPDSFMAGHEREEWLFNPEFVARTERYAVGLLRHENRYSGHTYASDPAIAVVEIMNEPGYPDYEQFRTEDTFAPLRGEYARRCAAAGLGDFPQAYWAQYRHDTVRAYLERMCGAFRAAGCAKPIVWNLNWPGMIGAHEDVYRAVAESPVDAVSFCCYPGQSDVPNPFWKYPADLSERNYLPYLKTCYTEYGRLRWLLGERFAGKAKVVYEFESMYNHSPWLYPAMARLFRSLGAQIAPMWQYTLSPVAEYIGGSHYLNLYCTPAKGVSYRIAGRVFSDTPRLAPYPEDAETEIGDGFWRASYTTRSAVLRTPESLLYSGPPGTFPIGDLDGLREIVGRGDSPAVAYDGTGSYSIRVGDGELLVRLFPDATYTRPVWQRPPANPPARLCELDTETVRHLEIRLPGWSGIPLRVERRVDGKPEPAVVAGPALSLRPGTYRITRTTQR